jgi:transcriptional regulator with XRE-family HTH domain
MLHLRKLRQERYLTQLALSKMLQISASAIGMYEQGRREPDHDTLAKIADFFNVSTDYLLGRTDYRKSFTHGLLGKPEKLIGNAQQSIANQQAEPNAAWNPPPEFFTDPETGKLIEAMNISDTHKRIILASAELSPEELNRIADLMETMAESHRK